MTKEKSRSGRYNNEDFSSIRLAMLVVLILGAAIAALLFLSINLGVKEYITINYLSEEKVKERNDKHVRDLQEYVTENNLTVNDAKLIAEWAKQNKYVYVLIFNGDQLLFDSGADAPSEGDGNNGGTDNPADDKDAESGDSTDMEDGETGSDNKWDDDKNNSYNPGFTVSPPSREDLIEIAKSKGSEPINTVDGEMLFASMVDYSEYLYYDIGNIVSVIAAMIAFVVTMWVYFYSLTRRITKLGKEVTAVADGDINHPVAIGGDDEIARLSMDIEYMRNSMLENIKKERAALDSNKELITAMSHDIRTPLTVLLGYLDIMKQSASDDTMLEYIDASEKTAMRLKSMSDDMFRYFLVYGGAVDVEMDRYDAGTLIDQLLSGYIFLLREQGYNVKYNLEMEGSAPIVDKVLYTDPSQLTRIVENVFSNLLKYADKEKPITADVFADTDELTIKVVNYVLKNPDESLKNGIGLKTCMKIASAMDIRLSAFESDGIYETVICVPQIPDVEYETDESKTGFVAWAKKKFSVVKLTLSSLFLRKNKEPKSSDTENNAEAASAKEGDENDK